MKKSLLFIVFLLTIGLINSSLADTTTHGMSIPDAHPRLWWNASRITQAQTWYAAHPFTASNDYERAWKHVINGDSCATPITWLMANGVSYDQWQPGANGSDDSRNLGELAALIYDWCFDALTTQQKSDFWHNINGTGYGWEDYLTGINQQSWGGPTFVESNYNWGNIRNDIMFGIAGITENAVFAESLLDNGFDTRWTDNFISAANNPYVLGAVPGEGDAYGTSIANYPIIPFQTATLLGRSIYSESDWFKQFPYYVIYATTPAETYHKNQARTMYQIQPYGDDEQYEDGGMLDVRGIYQNVMYFYSNLFSSINIGKDARLWYDTVTADADISPASIMFLAQDASPGTRALTNLPLDYYASRQYLYGRKAWDTSSAYFFLQMASAFEHGHRDAGNFSIWRGGRWLTKESTGYANFVSYYGYRALATSDNESSPIAHNTIVFSTPLYDNDVTLMPSVTNGLGTVTRLESTADYSYATVDLTDNYKWSDNYAWQYDRGAAVHVEREFLFIRSLETFVTLDRITTGNVIRGIDTGVTAANEVNSFILQSETNPTQVDANHISIVNGTQKLYVSTLVPATPDATRIIDSDSCSGCSPGIGLYRIEIDTHGAAQRYFLNVMQAMDSGDSPYTATVVDSNPGSSTAGTFTVTINSNTVIVFNKGQVSSGGTISVAGGSTTDLRTSVQSISYTDNGPVWGGNGPGPDAPVFNTATGGSAQASLAWSSVSGATGYRIKRGTATGVYTVTTNVGNVTSSTVTSLSSGTTYYFAITAYNADNESLKSNELSATTSGGGGGGGSVPSATTLNSATSSDTQVNLAWNTVSGATGYKIKRGISTGVYNSTIDVNDVTSYDVTELTNGTPYYFVIVAYNGVGDSSDSNEMTATPGVEPPHPMDLKGVIFR